MNKKYSTPEGKIQKTNRKNPEYDWKYKSDQRWLQIDDEVVPIRRTKQKRNPFRYSYEQQLIIEEMINTILSDSTLSESGGNPEYYPPVPQYTLPNETQTHIPRKKIITKKESFSEHALWTSNHPISIDEWEVYNSSTSPYINTGTIYTHLQSMRTIQSMTITERYSYPNIVERVKWLVTFLSGSEGEEIIGIYCWEHKEAINELTAFLAETPVSNEGDRYDAILNLSQLHNKL